MHVVFLALAVPSTGVSSLYNRRGNAARILHIGLRRESVVRMPEPGDTGSTEEMFRCPRCGTVFPTDGEDEGECPNDGTRCTRDHCLVITESNVGY